MALRYFAEGIRFSLPHPRKTTAWLRRVARAEGKSVGEITFVFCSDSYLLRLNQQFKRHNTLTDILTFAYDDDGRLTGDIFLAIPRVRENAKRFKASFADELARVMVHGLLHLAGYKDSTLAQKAKMRRKEAQSLSLRQGFT